MRTLLSYGHEDHAACNYVIITSKKLVLRDMLYHVHAAIARENGNQAGEP